MNQHVGRFDVSVDNVHRGQVLAGYRNLVSGLPPVKMSAFFYSLFQRTTFTKLGDDVVVVDGHVHIYECQSVGMINFLQDPDLVFQELFAMRFDIIQIDNLYGHNLLPIIVLKASIDCTRETASDNIIQFVTVRPDSLFGRHTRSYTVLSSIQILIL